MCCRDQYETPIADSRGGDSHIVVARGTDLAPRRVANVTISITGTRRHEMFRGTSESMLDNGKRYALENSRAVQSFVKTTIFNVSCSILLALMDIGCR
jgi:hypothetical protein